MRHVPIAEFKDRLSEIVAAAEAGEDIVITRHGRDVVRLSGVEAEQRQQRRAALEDLARLREEFRQEGLAVSSDEWVAWREEGRR